MRNSEFEAKVERVLRLTIDRWPEILVAFGISDSFLSRNHGPCPVCGGKDRFRFDDKDGRGTWYCNKCKAGDGVRMLELFKGWEFVTVIDELDKHFNGSSIPVMPRPVPVASSGTQKKDPVKIRRKLVKAWKASSAAKPEGAFATYLRNRGLFISEMPCVLRDGKDEYWQKGKTKADKPVSLGVFDVGLAVVQAPNGKPICLYRIYIKNGQKAPVPIVKKMMENFDPLSGAAIRLFEPTPDGKLGVCEGIEKAIAIHLKTGLPMWAVTGKEFLVSLVLPPEVNTVYVFGDNDPDDSDERPGQVCAQMLGDRLTREGRTTKVFIPPTVEEDWEDIYVRKYVRQQKLAA